MSGTCPECGTPNPKHHWGTTYFCENKACGAMLNMNQPDVRNIYTALRFEERRDLHLTLRYYPKVQPRGEFETNLVQQIGLFWEARKPEPFMLTLGERAMFGPRHNIPVLLATGTWPTWVEPLRLVVPVPAKDAYAFRPHVTTDEDGPLTLKVTAVALMHKDNGLWEWEL